MKSILVTGASTGIGEASALRLDRLGHRVYAGVRKGADADRLKDQGSERLVPVHLDVTDTGQIEAVVKQIADEAGGLAGLVNNAGIGKGGPVEYTDLDEWRKQFEVNVFGQVAVTKAMLPLIRRGQGRVVFIGSIGGKVSSPFLGPYSASKFAIEAIGEALRSELHPWGIGVSVVEPGSIDTAIWGKATQQVDQIEKDLPEEAKAYYGGVMAAMRNAIEVQARRGIPAERVARAVEHALFSSHPRTRYPVGIDARAQTVMVRLLPDRLREAIVRRFVGV